MPRWYFNSSDPLESLSCGSRMQESGESLREKTVGIKPHTENPEKRPEGTSGKMPGPGKEYRPLSPKLYVTSHHPIFSVYQTRDMNRAEMSEAILFVKEHFYFPHSYSNTVKFCHF